MYTRRYKKSGVRLPDGYFDGIRHGDRVQIRQEDATHFTAKYKLYLCIYLDMPAVHSQIW